MDDPVISASRSSVFLLAVRKSTTERAALGRRRDRVDRLRRMRMFYEEQSRQRMMFVMLLSMAAATTSLTACRSLWAKERSTHWWDTIVNGTFSDADWLENFRMSRQTFAYLCNELRPRLSRSDTNLRKAIAVEHRVAIAIWRLATNVEYRTIGHLFGVSKPSVCIIVNEVCSAIVTILMPRFIRLPTGGKSDEVVAGFRNRWGFPQCAAAVDGTHIPIIAPNEYHADYHNRKGWYSILMQAVVDHDYRFTDVYIGWPGRVHDARVFANSKIFRRAEDNTLFPNDIVNIEGVQMPIVLLGDPAYPLMTWLMKPFSDNGRLTGGQTRYNYRLSKARMVVENAFGRLKGRWRCLLKRNDNALKNVPNMVASCCVPNMVASCCVPNMVASCCVLHNLCETWGESFDETWLQEVDQSADEFHQPNDVQPENQGRGLAENIRRVLVAYFGNN